MMNNAAKSCNIAAINFIKKIIHVERILLKY